MASPAERLAQSLEALQKLQQGGHQTIRSKDLSRVHRERLLKNGFLEEVIQGWYIPSRPDMTAGESTAWYTSFWAFCASYLNQRFGDDWCLSSEQSLLLHAEDWTVPRQLLVLSPKGDNKNLPLPHNTSLLIARYAMPTPNDIELRNEVRIVKLVPALITCTPKFFTQNPVEARAVLSIIRDASDLLSLLLAEGRSVIAGRLVGAFRNIGNNRIADDILKTMQAAGYDVRENDPFTNATSIMFSSREQSPYVNRMHILWDEMRTKVIDHFPKPPGIPADLSLYMKQVEATYTTDAYHSLSIEGYQVSAALIEKVKTGNWNPNNESDLKDQNALAARGYWQAFQAVEKSIYKVISQANPGQVAYDDHGTWYRQLFEPSVNAGILKPSDLAGYRDAPIYIRRSMHVPPSRDSVRDLMPALFQHLIEEKEAAVRVVLGHFFFVYIHPYIDGNGRIGRFLMNVMLASGGYSWMVIPVELRDRYMAALEEASVNKDIVPFCEFLAGLVGVVSPRGLLF